MSFRLKTIIGIAIIEAVLLVLLIAHALHYLQRSNEKQLTEHAETTLSLLATASRDAVLSWDLATLDTIVVEARAMPGLGYVRILDPEGKVLAAAGRGEIPAASAAPDTGLPADGVFDQSIEIRESDSVFGRIEVGLDVADIGAIFAEARNRVIAIALVEIVLVALFSYVLGTFLTRQLSGLMQASHAIAGGDYTYRVSVRTKDELGQAGEAFNRMASQLETERRRERTIMETAMDGIVSMDHEGRIVDFNPAAERILGYPRFAVVGRNLAEVMIPPAQRDAHERGMAHYMATGTGRVLGNRVEVSALHATGLEFPVELSVNDTRIDGKPFFVAYVRDITQRLQGEAALREAMEAAEAGNRAKSSFLAVMSHEIRTPLNALLGVLGLLRETELNLQQHQWVDTALGSGKSLLALINDLLDFTKIESGRVELENAPVDIRSVLESTLEMVTPRAADKGLDLAGYATPGVPAGIVADEGRLRQVLVNLAGNAVKFTDRGSVLVEIDRVEREGEDRLRVVVSDSGPGIPDDARDSIFAEFAQLDPASSRRHEGSGLGLAISRRLVEAMGGAIGVDCPRGGGSRFWFEIPLAVAENSLPGKSPERLAGAALVMEPGAASRTALGHQLGAMGIDTRAVAAEAELDALPGERAPRVPPRWILIARELVDQDPALPARLRARFGEADARLLLTVAPNHSPDCADIVREGFSCYLQKPVRTAKLRARLGDHVCQVADGVRQIGLQGPACTDRLPRRLPSPEKLIEGRVLLAEDSPANQMVVLAMLRNTDLQIDTAANGREALEALERFPYDLVLMDVRMPEMDGIEATARIRSLGDHRSSIPVVALTANAMRGDRETYLEQGFDDYLAKPVEKPDLLDMLSKWLPNRPEQEDAATGEQESAVPGTLDTSALERLARDTAADLLPGMIEAFVREVGARQIRLEEAVSAGNLETARREAHSIKGAAGFFGAPDLQAAAEALEDRCTNGDALGAREMLSSFEGTVAKTLGAYRAYEPV